MLQKFTRLILFALLLVMAAGCARDEEETPTAVPTPIADATAIPTQVPTAAASPTALQPAPTAIPSASPTAPPAPTPVAEEAPERVGLLRFRDAGDLRSGRFQLLLENVAAPPAGTHYELWLVDESFNTLNLGPLDVTDGQVNFEGETDQNLLAAYGEAFISVEPDGVEDGEIGAIAYRGVIPAGSLLHVRHVVTAFGGNPDAKAFLVGAQEQLHHAMEHTGFLLDELDNENMGEAHRHAEHVVNILDGETGNNFGDLDGDSLAQNPGDGVGVRGYLEGARQHATLAMEADGTTDEVALHGEHVLISSDNSLVRVASAMEEALRVIASDSAGEARPAAETVAELLTATLDGVDANGDGAVAPIADEGGIVTAYVHALNMGALEFFPAGDGRGAGEPAADAAPQPTEEASEEDGADAPAGPTNVTVDMANFAYAPGDLTVAAGTTVTWANQDTGPRHSATAADGTFDTGLFNGGETASFTFDEPGTYVYYCTLHGSPDGSGMAATITVTE